MDPVQEIKAKISIDQLVGQYVQLEKKGRNFVGLCPFHQDSHPSFLVSPDKGISYCFPCQKGGDIFSFYQEIEHVDFRQALKDLAEQAGVNLPEAPQQAIHKDEKDKMRECLDAACAFYQHEYKNSTLALEYAKKRKLEHETIQEFALGYAPDSFTATYDHLLKSGFSRTDILSSGIGAQKDLDDTRVYDRFRNRFMFPIHDARGKLIGFGGRTLGNDDAKYLNSAETPLYNKSRVLYNLHRALSAMRETKRVVLVEGYFDAIACYRSGVQEVVATCGTSLTEDHVKLLKRYVERVVLCMDQDAAGRAAAERAFMLCSKEGLQVEGVLLPMKDPADVAEENPEMLKKMLTTEVKPFLHIVLAQIRSSDLSQPTVRHAALERIMPLLASISSSTERSHALREAAAALGTTETALADDLRRNSTTTRAPTKLQNDQGTKVNHASLYSSAEITLALIMLYPRNMSLLAELIEPEKDLAKALFQALNGVPEDAWAQLSLDQLEMDGELKRQASILLLYCEEQGLSQWNDATATREIKNNCRTANKEVLHKKQREITQKLLEARKTGNTSAEIELTQQYRDLLQISQKSH